MADEPIEVDEPVVDTSKEPLPDESLPDQPEPEDERPRRSLWGLLGIVVLVVIVVLILFLLKDCRGGGSPYGGSGRKTIERVPNMEPVAGSVSLWISRDTTLKKALLGADVRALDSLSLGEGRYVIQVREGTENRAARALATQPGVFDAGRVYDTPADK